MEELDTNNFKQSSCDIVDSYYIARCMKMKYFLSKNKDR